MEKRELYLSEHDAKLIDLARPGQPVIITPKSKDSEVSDLALIMAKEFEIQMRYGVNSERVYIAETPAAGY